MKQGLSVFLTIVLIFSMSATALAADSVNADVKTKNGTVQMYGISYPEEAREVFRIMNRVRQDHGLYTLSWDSNLERPAILRGLESMVYWSHTRPNGQSWKTVSTYANGENLAKGDTNAADVMDGWMNSPTHMENILDDEYTSVAVACVEGEDGTFHWVQLFGTANGIGDPAGRASSATTGSTGAAAAAGETASSTTILSEVDKAVAGAGAAVSARVVNAGSIAPSTLQSAAGKAAAAGKTLTIHADTQSSAGSVQGRLYINPAAMQSLTANLQTGVYVDSAQTQTIKTKFESGFSTTVAVVSLAQQGSFGSETEVAAKVDLTGLNTGSLLFYAYDRQNNTYNAISNPRYSVDNGGFLHFHTTQAGDIIITNKAL